MGRRGNPYDNAKVESFMKTLKVEAVYQCRLQCPFYPKADMAGPFVSIRPIPSSFSAPPAHLAVA